MWCDLKLLEDEVLCHGGGDFDENLENCHEPLSYLELRNVNSESELLILGQSFKCDWMQKLHIVQL